MFKIMLVDDSLTMRSALREALTKFEFEIVAQASSGVTALPRIKFHKPAVLLLDLEMPGLSGIEVLQEVKKETPETQVIIFSGVTENSAALTIEALELGAFDFIGKPTATEDFERFVEDQLVPRIRLAAKTKKATSNTNHSLDILPPQNKKINLCAIGISTGGPNALRRVLPAMPSDIGCSFLIVQHMPAFFTKSLADSLDSACKITVVEAEDGMPLKKGTAYIAPGGLHMQLNQQGQGITITNEAPEESCKPSANKLFRSIARANRGNETAAIIMTGMGHDGFSGLKDLYAQGAHIIAQNQESCIVFGMPALPIEKGLAHDILHLDQIAESITSLVGEKDYARI